MSETWDPGSPGVVVLPSGRTVRGRALRQPQPDGPQPQHGLYLAGHEPPMVPWTSRWLRWPDFRLPADKAEARKLLEEAWRNAAELRVEVACWGGRGRTGTALACIAVLDGVPPAEAVAYVRARYDPRAAETPWQRKYVARFGQGNA
ncbi:protein-tyrosine phosphatase family protein [Arthrobacter sp. CDRTa11]|uniref:protein-tyrosine phosphatase family protein n=1 Tax=Arthrobacter sp. CDRTa11 TaxID=2651199 RepID=UPI002265DC66|nr:protein phosphatase [Arthrobacter sp. CDRTa11]